MALLPASGRGARTLSRYVLAGLVPLCLLAFLVLDRTGDQVPAVLLSNPALQAAADLERAAQLELSAAGVKAPAQSQSLLGGQLSSPVFQTIKQHEAQAAAPAPAGLSQMTDSSSRDDLNNYFDSFKAPNSPKLAAVNPSAPPAVVASGSTMPESSTNQLLAAKLAEQDAVIKELKGEVKSFEASVRQKQEEQDKAKAMQQAAKQAMADSRAKAARLLANQQGAAQQQQAAAQQQQQMAAAQQAIAQLQLQQQQLLPQQLQPQPQQRAMAAGSSEAALERAIGEAILGHSSAHSATSQLAKLLQPHQSAKAARSTYGQRVRRDQLGVPVITQRDLEKLPGVNVAQWADPRVEREVASSVWRKAHPLNSVEGGSQLASIAIPLPAAASDCPICAFNEDCSINLKARGFHRASGLADNMPAYNGAITPYGGGGAHMSSLHANVAGVTQSEPLWDKLNLGLGDQARAQQLALQSVEGGQQLASIAIPPPAAEEPEPVAFCECPRCKLGEEQVGFGDELHMKQVLEDPDLLTTIDDELMRLDPSYALRRVDGEATTLGLATLGPNGKANPMSDFTDGPPYSGREAEYTNQVEPKTDTVWKSRTQSLQQKSSV